MIIKYEEKFHFDWQNGVMNFGDLYHDIRWKDIISKTYRLKPEYYVSYKENKIVGGFPAFRIGKKLVSLPYLPYSGWWGIISREELTSIEFQNILTKNISINNECKLNDYVIMRLDLPSSEDELWNIIGSKTRNLVRKSIKNNFRIEETNIEDFYKIYCKATNALGTPPHSLSFFRLIYDLFKDEIRINICSLHNEQVSCILEIDYKEIRYDLWAFSLKDYFEFSPNMFLYYETLKDAIVKGIKVYDFGRSAYGEGTYFFKKQWGAKPVKLDYIQYSGVKKEVVKKKDTHLKNLFPKIWSKLPNVCANIIGPELRKFIT